MKQINIIINLQIEGVHNWSTCNLDEVGFLKFPHRHIFYICCKKKVSHSDRDIEIIMLKREVEKYLKDKYGSPCIFNSMSCEMIALELQKKFNLLYCSVLEDNENGAEVEIKEHIPSPVFGEQFGIGDSEMG